MGFSLLQRAIIRELRKTLANTAPQYLSDDKTLKKQLNVVYAKHFEGKDAYQISTEMDLSIPAIKRILYKFKMRDIDVYGYNANLPKGKRKQEIRIFLDKVLDILS